EADGKIGAPTALPGGACLREPFVRKTLGSAVLAAGILLAAGALLSSGPYAQEQAGLKPASEFDSIADKSARSIALFEEAGKGIMNPRRLELHPAGGRP